MRYPKIINELYGGKITSIQLVYTVLLLFSDFFNKLYQTVILSSGAIYIPSPSLIS